MSQLGKELFDQASPFGIVPILDDFRYASRSFFSKEKHPQTIRVLEFNVRMLFGKFFPKPPDAEPSLADRNIVEEDDSLGRNFGSPQFKVVFYRFVSVQPINMKQVNGSITELVDRLIKGHPEQF